jgi:asparagine synthase (glutamine-hydrolysing)
MSGIFGAFTRDREPIDDAVVVSLLGGLAARGSEISAVWQRDGAALGVMRQAWEQDAPFSGNAGVVSCDDVTIAADASLYYRRELSAKLAAAGVQPAGDSPNHLILAAYRAWGRECVRRLEGDFAFVLWDTRRREVFCARDFAGGRPLFYLNTPRRLLIGSTVAALRAVLDETLPYDDTFLAEVAANLWLSPDETAYTSIKALPAGFALSTTPGGAVFTYRAWSPPAIDAAGAPPFDEAAIELRETLARAVTERIAGAPVASVWMSGGRDSTAIFGVGQRELRGRTGSQLRPVSVSYPVGHRGREDEFITAVAEFWNVPVQWLDSADIPFFADPVQQAWQRDEPYAPPYEAMNRALARGSRSAGARIALDGWGGDQLFELSPIYLADLFRRGQWLKLRSEWRRLQIRNGRFFLQSAIVPAVPAPLRALTGLRGDLDRRIPAWITSRCAKRLAQRQQSHLPTRGGASFADHELYVSLTTDTAARVRGWLSAISLDEGVEVRSPLYDARVIELAVRRPAEERRSGRDTKLLLRAALRGLLPDEVLAPRRDRTGLVGECFRAAMQSTFPTLLRAMRDSFVLADLGIIDPGALRRAADDCLRHTWNDEIAAALFFTLQTELWLRGVDRTVSHDDGQQVAVLAPGKRPGNVSQPGGSRCTKLRSSSASALSGISQ